MRGVNTGSVGEGWERGGMRRVVDANAAFVSTNTKLMHNRHITREFEVMLDKYSEFGRGGRGEIPAGIIAVQVGGQMLGKVDVTRVRRRVRGGVTVGGRGRRGGR